MKKKLRASSPSFEFPEECEAWVTQLKDATKMHLDASDRARKQKTKWGITLSWILKATSNLREMSAKLNTGGIFVGIVSPEQGRVKRLNLYHLQVEPRLVRGLAVVAGKMSRLFHTIQCRMLEKERGETAMKYRRNNSVLIDKQRLD